MILPFLVYMDSTSVSALVTDREHMNNPFNTSGVQDAAAKDRNCGGVIGPVYRMVVQDKVDDRCVVSLGMNEEELPSLPACLSNIRKATKMKDAVSLPVYKGYDHKSKMLLEGTCYLDIELPLSSFEPRLLEPKVLEVFGHKTSTVVPRNLENIDEILDVLVGNYSTALIV
jgi:hypothetical protein